MTRERSFQLRRFSGPATLVFAVCGVTGLARTQTLVSLEALAASPERIAHGEVWLLFSSAFVVDRPVLVSLLGFGMLAMLTLQLCGPRLFWFCALVGHVGSTLLVYGLIETVRAVDPDAYAAAETSPDYGVSAITAAWLGAIAAVAWQGRGRDRRGRAALVLCCGVLGVFAYMLRPQLTVLSSEHVVAFAGGLGAAVTRSAWLRPASAATARTVARPRPATAGRVSAALTGVLVLLLGAAAVPEALGGFAPELLGRTHPTAVRCAADWNRSPAAPRNAVASAGIRAADIAVERLVLPRPAAAGRHHLGWADYCVYTFTAGSGERIVARGLWRHGHVAAWKPLVQARPHPRAQNATIAANGTVRLDTGRHATPASARLPSGLPLRGFG